MADTLKKAAVVQFLDAVKSSLNYLSQLKMELADHGGQPQNGVDERSLLQLYSRVRRIREYLRRWMSAYPTPTTLEMPEDDINLLCSCLVHDLGETDRQLSEKAMKSKEDVPWLEKRKKILSHWTVELATEPIEQLPSLWQRKDVKYEVRQVLVTVRQKTTKSKSTGQTEPSSGVYRLGSGSFRAVDQQSVAPALQSQGGASAPPATPQSGSSPAIHVSAAIVDANLVRDYRIRMSMVLDVRAYHRCVEADDYRLALVLLSMIVEGILLDYGMLKKQELGLPESPVDWPLHQIAAHVLETSFGDRERAALQILDNARRALQPATQLEHPVVVNKPMVQEVEVFVRRVADAVGVGASSAAHVQPGPGPVTATPAPVPAQAPTPEPTAAPTPGPVNPDTKIDPVF